MWAALACRNPEQDAQHLVVPVNKQIIKDFGSSLKSGDWRAVCMYFMYYHLPLTKMRMFWYETQERLGRLLGLGAYAETSRGSGSSSRSSVKTPTKEDDDSSRQGESTPPRVKINKLNKHKHHSVLLKHLATRHPCVGFAARRSFAWVIDTHLMHIIRDKVFWYVKTLGV